MTKGMQEQKKNEDGVYLFTSVRVRCNTESCFHHRGGKKQLKTKKKGNNCSGTKWG